MRRYIEFVPKVPFKGVYTDIALPGKIGYGNILRQAAVYKTDRFYKAAVVGTSGFYKLWDSLLERFPNLMIDDCASGGRRIDLETLKRSVPLWRSDYQCHANYDVIGAQCHNQSFNTWLPFSGTGVGRGCDEYRVRSAYS